MLTVDELKRIFNVEDDKDLATIFGRKKSIVSTWRVNGIPAIIERRAQELIGKQSRSLNLQVEGANHHIDISHVSERPEDYSPATAMILDVISEWDEIRRRKLAAKVIEMNGEGDP